MLGIFHMYTIHCIVYDVFAYLPTTVTVAIQRLWTSILHTVQTTHYTGTSKLRGH